MPFVRPYASVMLYGLWGWRTIITYEFTYGYLKDEKRST
jgi:hypothetical protein